MSNLTFKTSDTLASGDYELRVAAITEAGTGVYGFYNPQTVFVYNFESNRMIHSTDSSITNTYPYWPSGYQITEDIQSANEGDVCLLKGESWQGNEGRGLIHRSPQVKSGQRRLFLSLDFMND